MSDLYQWRSNSCCRGKRASDKREKKKKKKNLHYHLELKRIHRDLVMPLEENTRIKFE